MFRTNGLEEIKK